MPDVTTPILPTMEPPTSGFTVWHRPGRGRRWEPLATAPTEREAYDLAHRMRRGGEWYCLPAGREP